MKKTIIFYILAFVLIGFIALPKAHAQENATEYDPNQGTFTVPEGGVALLKIGGQTFLSQVTRGSVTAVDAYVLEVGADQSNVVLGTRTFSHIPAGSLITNNKGVIEIIPPGSSSINYQDAKYTSAAQAITVQQDGTVRIEQGATYEKGSVVVKGPATIGNDQVRLSPTATYTDGSVKVTALEEMTVYQGFLAISDFDFDSKGSRNENGVLIKIGEIRGIGRYQLEIGKIKVTGRGDEGISANSEGGQAIPDLAYKFTHARGIGATEDYNIRSEGLLPGTKSQVVSRGNEVIFSTGFSKITNFVSGTTGNAYRITGTGIYRFTGGRIGWIPEAQQTPEAPPTSLDLELRTGLNTNRFENGQAWADSSGRQWIYVTAANKWKPTGLTMTRGLGWVDQQGRLFDKDGNLIP